MSSELKDLLPLLVSLIAVIIAAISAAIAWKRAPGDIGETMTKIANLNAEKRLTLEERVKELEELVLRGRFSVTVIFTTGEEPNVEKVEIKRLRVEKA